MLSKIKSLIQELTTTLLAYPKKPLRLFGLGLLFILLVATSYYRDIVFITKENSLEIPAEITFHFILDGIQSENIYVKRSAKDDAGIKVDGTQKTITTTYNYPGYFKARLLVDNKTVKTSDVFIKTDGWLATIPNTYGYSYLKKETIVSNNSISIPRSFVKRKNVEKVTFHYFDQINPMSGLDFALEADLQTIKEAGNYTCDKVNIEIVGSNSSTIIPISLSACSIQEPIIIAGHEYFKTDTRGKFLVANSNSDWQQFKLKVHGGIAQISINSKEELRLLVKSSMGQITGLRFHFEGNGSIKNIKLTDTQEVTYVPSF